MGENYIIVHLLSLIVLPMIGGVILHLQGKGSYLSCTGEFMLMYVGLQIAVGSIIAGILIATCGGIFIGITPKSLMSTINFFIGTNVYFIIPASFFLLSYIFTGGFSPQRKAYPFPKQKEHNDPIISFMSNETLDLMNSLKNIDISSINSVTFLPKDGTGFMIKTANIKRLAVYITSILKKTKFESEELRKTFDYVVKHIQSNLSKRDFELVTGKIEEFVKSGGEVKIEKIRNL